MDILSEKEKKQVENFVKNEIMFEAVRKVLLQGIYTDGVMRKDDKAEPHKNFMFEILGSQMNLQGGTSNEAIGQNIKAKWEGIRIVELAFKELETLVESPKKKDKEAINTAR